MFGSSGHTACPDEQLESQPLNWLNMESVKDTFKKLNSLIIHSLAFLTASVSILVYGQTLLRGSGGGLFDQFRPLFGIPFALIIGFVLLTTLAICHSWKYLVVVLLGEIIHLLLLGSPYRTRPFHWDEYLMTSATIACLLASACLHFHLVDES